jgi:hypothetical protein
MQRTDREWALGVLGLTPEATETDIDHAYTEMEKLWTPHASAANPRVKTQGKDEIAKIQRARELLREETEVVPDEDGPTPGGLQPMALGLLLVTAFGLGFIGMFGWRKTHAPTPNLVASNAVLTSHPKVSLFAPDVSVSSQREEQLPPLTEDERQTIQDSIAGLADPEPVASIDNLESMGERAIPAVTEALRSDDGNTRMNAATVINSLAAGPDDAPNSPEDRARLLPIFKEAGTVPALTRLTKDLLEETRQNVAYALGNIGDPSSFDSLISMANDPAPSVRIGVAASLGKLKNLDAVPTLTALLNDRDLEVRSAAADGLKPFDTPEAKSALSTRLGEEQDPDVIDHIKATLEGRPDDSSDGQGI